MSNLEPNGIPDPEDLNPFPDNLPESFLPVADPAKVGTYTTHGDAPPDVPLGQIIEVLEYRVYSHHPTSDGQPWFIPFANAADAIWYSLSLLDGKRPCALVRMQVRGRDESVCDLLDIAGLFDPRAPF